MDRNETTPNKKKHIHFQMDKWRKRKKLQRIERFMDI